MDWKETILVKTKDKKSIVIPKSVIKFLGTNIERDYGGGEAKDLEVTIIHVDLEWARSTGMDAKYSDIKDTVLGLKLDMDLKVVLGLMRGDKAAEVLF